MVVENKVGVMAEAEMEEVARTDFQEEPGMMERSTHLSLVFCFTSFIVVVMFAFLSAISELAAWISSTPHLAKVHFHFLIKKKSAIKMMVTK